MFIPLKDDNPPVTFPLVTIGLILANGWVFFHQISLDVVESQRFIFQWGAIPHQLVTGQTLYGPSPVPVYFTLLSSMFLHGGFLHLFGNNIEDALGHFRFLLFYLFCGLCAALVQVFSTPGSTVPMIGASGAVAGVLGAYLLLFPTARILTLFFIIIIVKLIRLPAIIVLGFWFFLQLMGVMGGSVSNVAFFAHVGGFVAGMILVKIFQPQRSKSRRRWA